MCFVNVLFKYVPLLLVLLFVGLLACGTSFAGEAVTNVWATPQVVGFGSAGSTSYAQVVSSPVALATAQIQTVQPLFGLRNAEQSMTDDAHLFNGHQRRQDRRELREFRQNPSAVDHLFSKPTTAATVLVGNVAQTQVQTLQVPQTTCVQTACVPTTETLTVTEQVPVVTYETVVEERTVQVQKQVPRVEYREQVRQVQVPVAQETVIQQQIEATPPAIDGQSYAEFQE